MFVSSTPGVRTPPLMLMSSVQHTPIISRSLVEKDEKEEEDEKDSGIGALRSSSLWSSKP
jgi:hypothetical protein